jgi:hypothetical protein
MISESMTLPKATSTPALFTAALAALSLTTPLAAQTIDTNRPGFSFAPTVVPKNRLQLEAGMGYDRDSDSIAVPQAELRYGAADGIELFVTSLNWNDGERADMGIGSKIAISGLPDSMQMAALVQVSAPTGDSAISSDRWDPSAALIWAHTGMLSLAGTAKVTQFDNGVQVDNGLKLILPSPARQTAFLEWELNWPEGGDAAHWLNGGYQWLLSDSFQLDASIGVGLNDEAGDYRFGIGLARLF